MVYRFFTVLFLCIVYSSHAHDVFSGEAKALVNEDGILSIELKMAAVTADIFTQDIIDRNNQISTENLSNIRSHLSTKAKRFFQVTLDGTIITANRVDIQIISDDDSVIFNLFYPTPVFGLLGLRSDYIDDTNPEYKLTLTVFDAHHTQLGLFIHTFKQRYDQIRVSEKSNNVNDQGVFGNFIVLGIEHILIGFDHLIFLFALLIICRNWKDAAIIISCFTMAHTLTLSLASLELVSVPQNWVEVAIALTIVYVGFENLYFRHRPHHRWLLTSAFGLIHGLGFANVLIGIGLGGTGAPIFIPLFAFNLGVEIGQLALSAIVLPILWYFWRFSWYQKILMPLISLSIVGLGIMWMAERIV